MFSVHGTEKEGAEPVKLWADISLFSYLMCVCLYMYKRVCVCVCVCVCARTCILLDFAFAVCVLCILSHTCCSLGNMYVLKLYVCSFLAVSTILQNTSSTDFKQ